MRTFLAATLIVASPLVAAHVTLEPREAPAASYVKAVLRVTHGCKGSPTIRVKVRVPDGAMNVKPQPKPGWKVETVPVKLPAPRDNGHGTMVGEVVGEVIWSDGRLADDQFDEFAILMRLPDRPGATLHFPVVQECEQGAHRWVELPAAGKAAVEPAPSLRLAPKR